MVFQSNEDTHNALFDLVVELQNSHSKALATARKWVAPYGDAYFYCNGTGELCLVSDFTKISGTNIPS